MRGFGDCDRRPAYRGNRCGRRRRFAYPIQHRQTGPVLVAGRGRVADVGERLVVVAMWVAGGGVQSLGALASGLTGIGRLAGLVAANLMLIQVLLMARIPVVERVYGQDELARRHRLVGFTSVNLLVAHIVLVTLGYAAQDHLNPVRRRGGNSSSATRECCSPGPGRRLAPDGHRGEHPQGRRRLRYESWHLLHLYAYLGVGLAVPHQLWTGQEFVSSPLATRTGGRCGSPPQGPCWCGGSVCRSTGRSRSVCGSLGCPRGSPVGRRLGLDQRSPVATGCRRRRASSSCGASSAGPAGAEGTRTLWSAPRDGGYDADHRQGPRRRQRRGGASCGPERGSRSRVRLGRLQVAGCGPGSKVTLLAATGIGITPLRALLEEMAQQPGDVTLVNRASTKPDLIFESELEAVARAKGARVLTAIGHRVAERPSSDGSSTPSKRPPMDNTRSTTPISRRSSTSSRHWHAAPEWRRSC